MRPPGFLFALSAVALLGVAVGNATDARAAEAAAPADGEKATEGAATAPPYESPMRDQCTEELRKDARWRATLRNQLRDKIHDEDAKLMLRNKRHVVIAYASIWILTVGFLVLMWWRQRGLRAEIEELRADVRRAAKES